MIADAASGNDCEREVLIRDLCLFMALAAVVACGHSSTHQADAGDLGDGAAMPDTAAATDGQVDAVSPIVDATSPITDATSPVADATSPIADATSPVPDATPAVPDATPTVPDATPIPDGQEGPIEADVYIHIDNFCNTWAVPASFTVPAGDTLQLTYHNTSVDYEADVWLSYGGGYLGLSMGGVWADGFEFCSGPGSYTAYADISIAGGGGSACPGFRLYIYCE